MAPITIPNITGPEFAWIHSQLSGRPGAKLTDAPKTSDGITSGSVSGAAEALTYTYNPTSELLVLNVTHHRLLDLPPMIDSAIRHNIQQMIATMPAAPPQPSSSVQTQAGSGNPAATAAGGIRGARSA